MTNIQVYHIFCEFYVLQTRIKYRVRIQVFCISANFICPAKITMQARGFLELIYKASTYE